MQVGGVNSGNIHSVDTGRIGDSRGVAGGSDHRPSEHAAVVGTAQGTEASHSGGLGSTERGTPGQRNVDGDSVILSSRYARKAGQEAESTKEPDIDRGVGEELRRLGAPALELLTKTRDFLRKLWNGTGAEAGPVAAPKEQEKGADSLWQRFKLKVYTATGHLAKRFGGDPSLQTDVKHGSEDQKNELENQRSPEEEGEKDHKKQDKSYLMDSYDRKGNYTRLGRVGYDSRDRGKMV